MIHNVSSINKYISTLPDEMLLESELILQSIKQIDYTILVEYVKRNITIPLFCGYMAAYKGTLDFLTMAYKYGCVMNEKTVMAAITNNHIHCLLFLCEECNCIVTMEHLQKAKEYHYQICFEYLNYIFNTQKNK